MDLEEFLLKEDITKYGFADIRDITPINDLNYAIGFYKTYNKDTIRNIVNGSDINYIKEYRYLTHHLDKVSLSLERFIKDLGYKAYAQTIERFKAYYNKSADQLLKEDIVNQIPHKTIATKAGLGWIGKPGLLVTKD
ncbi:MAG: hypothetical protein Q4Q23_05855 [Methanobacteriaceae archaeon]|nr:hypothetical protein [Methanobacteriaceae archaeon]